MTSGLNPEFLLLEDILLVHSEQLKRYGGSSGIRDQGLLESAIAQPKASFGGEFVQRIRATLGPH